MNRNVVASVGLGLALCGLVSAARAQVPQATDALGVDVSSAQGVVDWSAVAASGRTFAFARAAFGLQTDSRFAANYAGIASAGLIRGAYQDFNAALDPTAQANFLLAEVGALGSGDLPLALDVETTNGQSPNTVAQGVKTWTDVVRAATGRDPIVYTGFFFWNTSVGGASEPGADLWIADYGRSIPRVPNGWPGWTFWQYSGIGSVPGIGFGADLDRFSGTHDQLQALAGVAPVPEPATWAIMILGFGSLGASLRRRRRGPISA